MMKYPESILAISTAIASSFLTAQAFAGVPTCSAPLRNTIALPSQPYELERNGDTLIVLTSDDGVRTYDLTNPLNPVFLDDYPVEPQRMKLVGNTLYCLNDGGVFSILDVSDPGNITLIAEHSPENDADLTATIFNDLDIVGSDAYFSFFARRASTGDQTVTCVTKLDLSNPQSPVYLAQRIFTFPDTVSIFSLTPKAASE